MTTMEAAYFVNEETICRHCGKVRRNQTTDFCYGCRKWPGDMTEAEEEEQQDMLIEIYRGIMRGDLP